jgi:hypothetical protein
MIKRINIYLFAIMLSAMAVSCKVKYTFTGASIPPNAKTVVISDFPNMAPLVNPNLSPSLGEALRDRFLGQTSLILVETTADLEFSGTITGYSTKPMGIKAGSDQAAQNRLTVSIKVKFVNRLDPKADFESSFSRYRDYESSNQLSDVEDQLVEEIIEELVDDIFNKSVVNW